MLSTSMKKKNCLTRGKSYIKRRPTPAPLVALGDVALIGLALLVFAYFHHVRSYEFEAINLVSPRGGQSAG